jgi:predicted TPR repeat methyltransferase
MISGFHDAIQNLDFDAKTVADLGCGFGCWAHLIRSEIDKHGENAYIIGCDIHRPYLEKTREYNPYDELLICDVRQLPFRPRIFNYIIAFEVIEHMSKEEGLAFLSDIETYAKDTVIVSTPLGYYEQYEGRSNKYEAHLAAWYPQEFL